MAIFTSNDGKFEITALSFSPRGVVWGESTSWSVTIKNLTGEKITKLAMRTHVRYKSTSDRTIASVIQWWLKGTDPSNIYATVSWAKNAEMTFSGTSTYDMRTGYPAQSYASRCLPAYSGYGLEFTLFWSEENTSIFPSLYGDNNEYLGILDQHYNPAIEDFDVERVTDDGINVKTTVKLSQADGLTDDQKARMTVSLVDGSGAAVTINATKDEMLTGITDSLTAITQTFSNSSNHTLTLVFGDEFEQKSRVVTIARAFANVHLSGDPDGGVCFGGFCDPNKPGQFECRYPMHAVGGIANFQTGVTDQASHDNGTEETITFATPFAAAPMVVAVADVTQSGSSFGGCFVAVKNVTAEGFTLRYANTSGSTRKFAVRWMAYGASC